MRPKLPLLVSFALAACHSSDSDSAPRPEPVAFDLELAAERLIGTGELQLVLASESAQGQDLDGDGDTTDAVVHVLDLRTFSLTNTGLAFARLPLEVAACTDSLAAFLVSERETGRDLDQDGNLDESGTWVFDRRTGALQALPFAHAAVKAGGDLAAFLSTDGGSLALHVFDARDGSLTTLPPDSGLLGVGEGIVAFLRDEAGVDDLNADGDASDRSVLHLYLADSDSVVNTFFDVAPFVARIEGEGDGAPLDFVPIGLHIEDGFASFNVPEANNGGMDLDGDAEADDLVFVAMDPRTGLTRIPGFSDVVQVELASGDSTGLLLAVSEDGLDRNGDGDAFDRVVVRYDPRSDQVLETGLAVGLAGPAPDANACIQSERWIGVLVREQAQGRQDLDGDGKDESPVPHVFDARAARSLNLGFSGFWMGRLGEELLGVRFLLGGPGLVELFAWDPRARAVRHTGADVRTLLGTSGDNALVSVAENTEDLNGDGDRDDFVFALYQARTGTVRSLRLATSTFAGSLSAGGWAAVLVSEQAQGADLNGDGDQLDQVLHQIFLDPPQG